ncbi:MAG TPA: peptide-methionine (S)-S-oxide reductase MsrA [Bacilli bacterium]|nr:peptide-methionine (S)-S-oxide reductase MsrA [Bacilli bacterium]
MIKKIVIAGGCFWGIEAFFSQLDGVIDAVSGYANSNVKNPSYSEVKSHMTTAVEAVEIKYDSNIVNPRLILSYLFKIIDVTAIDHQGGDYGHQYRSGIYYSSYEERDFAISMISELQKHCEAKIAIEVLPLENFYRAEDYHQKYLEKNPDGYCHINHYQIEPHHKKIDKESAYKETLLLLTGLLDKTLQSVTILANTSALLKEKFPFYSWFGFYLSNKEHLYLGPFQGKVACEKIQFGQGVCGTSFVRKQTIIVEDVHNFVGHIACDSENNSEIVVPLFNKSNQMVGVLDVDSYRYGAFDSADKEGLEEIIELLKNYLS